MACTETELHLLLFLFREKWEKTQTFRHFGVLFTNDWRIGRGPEDRAEMFLFRFSAILPWSAKSQHLSRSNFLIRIVFLFVTFYFAKKNQINIILLSFWHHSRFISDVWDLYKLNQVSSKVQIYQNSNRCQNEFCKEWIRMNQDQSKNIFAISESLYSVSYFIRE